MRSASLIISEIVKTRKHLCYDVDPLVDSGGGGNKTSDGLMPSLVAPICRRHKTMTGKRINHRIFDFHYFFQVHQLESFSSAGLIPSFLLSLNSNNHRLKKLVPTF